MKSRGTRFSSQEFWSTAALYLHVDVLDAGGYEWFSRNHVTGAFVGTTQAAEPELTAAFFRALVALRGHVEGKR